MGVVDGRNPSNVTEETRTLLQKHYAGEAAVFEIPQKDGRYAAFEVPARVHTHSIAPPVRSSRKVVRGASNVWEWGISVKRFEME
jgi:hypothetical protein